MNHRNLRIAWSVSCGIVGVAIFLLLVRSFWQRDALTTSTGDTIAESWRGRLGLNIPPPTVSDFHWQLIHESTADRLPRLDQTNLPVNPPFFQFYRLAGRPGIVAPHFYFVLLAAFLAATPYIQWRRNLRALRTAMLAAFRQVKNFRVRSKPRFAWHAGCALVCMLLIALWVRSYYDAYSVRGMQNAKNTKASFDICADYGFLGVVAYPDLFAFAKVRKCVFDRYGIGHKSYSQLMPYYARLNTGMTELFVPFWIILLLTIFAAALPSFIGQIHFSLRTLLGIMTLTALILGCVALFH